MEKRNGRTVIRRAEFSEAIALTPLEKSKIDAWLRGRGLDVESHRARQSAAALRKRKARA